MLGFWWVFTILMTSTYTANLAAYLTVSIPEQPINNLDELVAQTEIEPLVKSGTNIHTLFMVFIFLTDFLNNKQLILCIAINLYFII